MTRRSLLTLFPAAALAQNLPRNVGFRADSGPARSECGVGALMPWAERLWAVTYNSHMQSTGSGLGLYWIDDRFNVGLEHKHDGTHANRMLHSESSQAIIGPYAIDAKGNVRVIDSLLNHRITATMRHLTDAANRVYMLTMEGLLFEMDVSTLKTSLVIDLVKHFGINKRPHFKGGFTGQGRVLAANNGFYEFGENEAGLFEWNGKTWRALSRKPHMDCAGRQNLGNVVFCTGWDEMSVLFWTLVNGEWKRYRLPKASHTFDHAWQTEWTRIREVETERFLMDVHGMFYELQPVPFQGAIWGINPVCSHLRIVPDYCSFRGMFAVAGNQNTPNQDNNPLGGQPQSGIWFGKTDDLWQWGKPKGWGGVWRHTPVRAGDASEPFLMTGFDRKVLHLKAQSPVKVEIQVDFLGTGAWERYEALAVDGYRYHVFPAGFSAHWVRLMAGTAGTVTAEFIYT